MEERSNRRVDMDRYAKDLKTAQEKNKIDKIPTLEQKLAASKANYQTLHEELLKDLPLLYEDRIPFFDPVFATVSLHHKNHHSFCVRFCQVFCRALQSL